MRIFLEDCDLWGTDFIRYRRQIVREVLSVGRCGSLVLPNDAKRPSVSSYRTEDILNWRVERVGQGVALVEVVLRDPPLLSALRSIHLDGELPKA